MQKPLTYVATTKMHPTLNIQANSKAILLGFIFTFFIAFVSAPSIAGKNDFKLPVEIDSEKQQINLKENITIFDTNVSVTQGSLSINADYMKVTSQDKKGHEVYTATGDPAIYKQLLDDGNPIEAQADTIRYEVATRSLVLTGNAQLKQNDSLVRSKVIRYDLDLQTIQAEGTKGTRVKSVFTTSEEPAEGEEPSANEKPSADEKPEDNQGQNP